VTIACVQDPGYEGYLIEVDLSGDEQDLDTVSFRIPSPATYTRMEAHVKSGDALIYNGAQRPFEARRQENASKFYIDLLSIRGVNSHLSGLIEALAKGAEAQFHFFEMTPVTGLPNNYRMAVEFSLRGSRRALTALQDRCG